MSPIFQEAVREGYLIKRTDGTPWQYAPLLSSRRPSRLLTLLGRWDLWQPGLGVVDVTNPAARKWYQDKLEALIDLGVDTFKVRLPLSTLTRVTQEPHASMV